MNRSLGLARFGLIVALSFLMFALSFGTTETPALAAPNTSCPLTWDIVPNPKLPAAYGELNALAALAPDDIWAVGSSWNDSNYQPLTMHWDGSTWQIASAPINDGYFLDDVAAIAADDVWALGDANRAPVLLHWDGAMWNVMPNPEIQDLKLSSIAGSPDGTLWATGSVSAPLPDYGQPFVLHWDGAQWNNMTPPDPVPYTSFEQVLIKAPDEVYLRGGINTQQVNYDADHQEFFVEEWDGAVWSPVASIQTASQYQYYGSTAIEMLALDPNDIWFVGEDYAKYDFYPLIVHWNGSEWSRYSDIGDLWIAAVLGLAGDTPDNLWAVGHTLVQRLPGPPLLAHWDGSVWERVLQFGFRAGGYLADVAVLSENEVWAVGSQTLQGTGWYPKKPLIVHGSLPCATIPASPQLLSPQNRALVRRTKPLLKWSRVEEARYYDLQVRHAGDHAWRQETTTLEPRFKFVNDLESRVRTKWRVRACNSAGCGEWTRWWGFAVKRTQH